MRPLRREHVVVRDRLWFDARRGKHGDGDQAGAVAAADAVEYDATRPCRLDRVERLVEAVREALEEGRVVERCRELRSVHPLVPEVGILVQAVERHVHHVHAIRELRGLDTLVVVSQVDDRAHAVAAERRPAGGAESIHGVRADHRAEARLTAVSRREAAEVACVDAAFPVEVALGAQTDAPQLGSSSATRKEEPQPHEATTFGFETSNPEPWKLSVKSTVEPSTYSMLAGSTRTRMPEASKTWSSSRFSSRASAYWKPEQPPPFTPTRRPTSPSAPWPAMNSFTFWAAMSVSVTICSAIVSALPQVP